MKRLLRLLTWIIPMPLGWFIQQSELSQKAKAEAIANLGYHHKLQLEEQCRRDARIAEAHIRKIEQVVREVIDRYVQTQYLQQSPSEYVMNLVFDVRLVQGMTQDEHMSLIADRLCDRIKTELMTGHFAKLRQPPLPATTHRPVSPMPPIPPQSQ